MNVDVDVNRCCGGYKIRWTMEVKDGDAPWATRCAHCAATQVRKERVDFDLEDQDSSSASTLSTSSPNDNRRIDTFQFYKEGGG